MGEREQKRLYHAPLGDSIAGQPYPWVYYLLGGSKDQLAVWHGQQMTSPFCDTVRRRNVFLYPTEYITNGIGWNGVHEDITPIITKPDGSKEYRISDHLASLRVSLTGGTPMKGYDYDPWGSLLNGTPTRRMYNDREEDKESGLYNNGVRKLEDGLGRFTAIDPLWEKFPWQSPYVYGDNNPLGKTDPTGMQANEIVASVGVGVASTPASLPVAAGVGVGGLVAADAYVRSEYPALQGMPIGGALGTYLGVTLASEIFGGSEVQSDGGSSGGSSTPSGGSGGSGGGLGGGLGAAGVAGAKAAMDEVAKGGSTFFEGAKYSDKVLTQMSKINDLFHGFPKSVDALATKYGQLSTKIGADGKPYQWLQMSGSYGGKTGVFEYIKDANGVINHRMFNVPKIP